MYSLSARLQDVRRLLKQAAEHELSAQAIQRLKCFQFCLEHDGNISLTCRHFGIARSTFIRWAQRFDAKDVRTLEEHSRRPHTVRQPDTDRHVVALIRTMRQRTPLIGKEQIAEKLKQEYGIECSSSTVGRVIARYALFFADTPSHREKRIAAGVEERIEETGIEDTRNKTQETTREKEFGDDTQTSTSPFIPEPDLGS